MDTLELWYDFIIATLEYDMTDKYVTRIDFDAHLKDYEEYKMEDKKRHENLMAAIEKLTIATQGVVDAWTFANNFNKFIKWVASLGAIGTAFMWALDKFK